MLYGNCIKVVMFMTLWLYLEWGGYLVSSYNGVIPNILDFFLNLDTV